MAEFQRAHKLPVTGTVDGATRDAVQTVLAEPRSRFVAVGRVRWVDGQPANALTVGAFDRDLRDAEQLGEATTGDDGLYRVDHRGTGSPAPRSSPLTCSSGCPLVIASCPTRR